MEGNTKVEDNGYTACACRDCMEIAIGVPGEAFCCECEEAACPDYQSTPGMSKECQVEPELFEEDFDAN